MWTGTEHLARIALDRVQADLIRENPEAADAFRQFFATSTIALTLLSWAVANRVKQDAADVQKIARQSVPRVRELMLQDEPASVTIPSWFENHGALLEELGVALAKEVQTTLAAVAAAQHGGPGNSRSMLLRADPNPDFATGPHQATVRLAPRWVPVPSFADASKVARLFIRRHDLGGGNWTGGEVREDGVPVARVAYNGRVFQVESGDQRQVEVKILPEASPFAPRLHLQAVADSWQKLQPSMIHKLLGSAAEEGREAFFAMVTAVERERADLRSAVEKTLDALKKQNEQIRIWIDSQRPSAEVIGTRSTERTGRLAQITNWQIVDPVPEEKPAPSENPVAASPNGEQTPRGERGAAPQISDPAEKEPLDRRSEGSLWISSKLRLPLSRPQFARWSEIAAGKRRESLEKNSAYRRDFWDGVISWLNAHHPALAKTTPSSEHVPAKPVQEHIVADAELGRAKRIEKLRKLAESLAVEIEKLRDSGTHHQRPTARRARIAAGQEDHADGLEQVRSRLLALADALENKCEPPSLQGLDLAEYRCLPASLEGVDSRAIVEDLLRSEKMPQPGTWKINVEKALDLLQQDSSAAHLRQTAQAFIKRCGPDRGYCIAQDSEELATLEELSKRAEPNVRRPYEKTSVRAIRLEFLPYKRALAAGLGTQEQWERAREDLKTLGGKPMPVQDPLVRQIRDHERALIGLEIPGYFPTPPDLVERLVAEADLRSGQRVLEPSAGKGSIAEGIRAAGIEPDVIEVVPRLRQILALKKFRIVADDFLSFQGRYDRIVMNPPFEEGRDMTHVQHAYELLQPGGRLVAIMSTGPFFREDRKSREFREWLDQLSGDHTTLPEGSFLKSDRPTGVNTQLVVLDKPATAERKDTPRIAAGSERLPDNVVPFPGPSADRDESENDFAARDKAERDASNLIQRIEAWIDGKRFLRGGDYIRHLAEDRSTQEIQEALGWARKHPVPYIARHIADNLAALVRGREAPEQTLAPHTDLTTDQAPGETEEDHEPADADAEPSEVGSAADVTELARHGLRVVQKMTQPTRPNKKPRPVYVIEGDTAPYVSILRELGGRRFRGQVSFWNDPTVALARHLDEHGRPSIEERIADRRERSLARAERLEERADRKAAEAASAYAASHAIGDGIPMGQPILVGHHSEGRHRRDLERMNRHMGRSVAAQEESERLQRAAKSAARNADDSLRLPYVQNRIDEITAELNRLGRQLLNNPSAAERQRITLLRDDASSQLTYWENQLKAVGGIPYGPHNVAPGDMVRKRRLWYPVLRTNPKTVTISHWLNNPRLDFRVPWAEISGYKRTMTPEAPLSESLKSLKPGDFVFVAGWWYPVIRLDGDRIFVQDVLRRNTQETSITRSQIAEHRIGIEEVPTEEDVELQASMRSETLLDGFERLEQERRLGEPSAPGARQAITSCPPSHPACGLGLEGAACAVPAPLVIAGKTGTPEEKTARYCLTEASKLIPSHDPTRGFSPRLDYPAEVQERRYERLKDEQYKVVQLAQNLNPALIFNTSPGVIDGGPPVVTEMGIVLGGNGRTMGLQLHYHQGGRVARDYLIQHAQE